MKLKLTNVGKIKEADVTIDGITVIAGKNNTGKSTVSKSLYCIFTGLYNIDEKIKEDREYYIAKQVSKFLKAEIFLHNFDRPGDCTISWHKILDLLMEKNFEEAKKYLLEIDKDNGKIKDNKIDTFLKEIQASFDIPDEEFYPSSLMKLLNDEFVGQINNVNNRLASVINLTIKDNYFNIKIHGEKIEFNQYMPLDSDIVYIDDPFILDNIMGRYRNNSRRNSKLDHKSNIVKKLQDTKNNNITSNIILKEKIKSITNKLDSLGIGKLVKSTDILESKFKYQSPNDNEPIEIPNVSAGIKTFIIIKELILKGHIEDKGCIILDEPEIHLHPEWQLVFAELIVLLQKTFNMHILLNTHSPYFLRAIQVYAAKHEIADRCNYYLAENNSDNTASIKNVNSDVGKIYGLLSNPFQVLEDEAYDLQA